jgi:hypothetical protein
LNQPRQKIITKKITSVDWMNYHGQVVNEDLRKMTFDYRSTRALFDSINDNLITVLNKWAPKRIIKLRGARDFENYRVEAMKK